MEDLTLIERIGAGDRSAMKSLYERHSDALFHFARTRLRDPGEAGDVVQETFLEVWRAAARFEGRAKVRTWLFGIARNKAVDRMRKTGRTVLQEPDDTIPDDAPTPEATVAQASDAARLRGCIEGLGAAQRAAIRLAFYEGLTYPQVAEAEGVPLGTIKTRVHHAKKLLLACLSAAAPQSA